MRSFIPITLVVAGLASSVFGHSRSVIDDGPVKRRKTLAFGPAHPHTVFHSSPYQIQTSGFMPHPPKADPVDVANDFLTDLLTRENHPASRDYRIRRDSYTDKNTGVTHVYARQYVGGVEVVDGDINLNIKDGKVLSYGNSFYKGVGYDEVPRKEDDVHGAHCTNLAAELDARRVARSQNLYGNDQVILGEHGHDEESVQVLEHLHESNCDHPQAAHDNDMDPLSTLLHFMIAATPSKDLASNIKSEFSSYVDKMSAVAEHSLTGTPAFEISGVPDTVNPVKAKLAFVQVPEGDSTKLSLVWRYEVEMQDNWYEVCMSATGAPKILSVVDWASDSPMPIRAKQADGATYNVFPWGVNDPSEGERTIEKENFDSLASPVGWHSLPFANDPSVSGQGKRGKTGFHNTTTTWGNNVFAHEDWEGQNNWQDNYRPDAGDSLAFDFKYDPKSTSKGDALAEAKKYINATVTQLFYTSNKVHDLYYRYGFDEVSGNFQQHNFGRGGKENDAVIANAQDGSGYNNANFMTPPDGQNGRCRMYLWNTAMPFRDGDLEAGIVIHELSHGLSTRLTGGPANSGCLGWGEAGGMGEGWGDFLATVIRSTKEYSDYPMGAWAANQAGGIRNYPYSTSNKTNPSTYKILDKGGYWGVHAIGEVWAEFLFILNQRLIAKHGYSETLYPPMADENGVVPEGDFYRAREYTSAGEAKPLVPKHGNTLAVQLVFNGMKLQPCRPSFFDARKAIIQADQILTGGENFCDIWTAFAERGLGPQAKLEGSTPWGGGFRTNDFSVPLNCQD